MGIGLNGTTPIITQQMPDGSFEARMGIAMFGMTNMKWEDIERIADPFSPEWNDNYSSGKGATEQEARDNLSKDFSEMYESIWD